MAMHSHSLDPTSLPLLNAVTQNPQQPQDQKNQISATRQGNIRSYRSISHGDRSSTGGSFLVSTVPTVHWKVANSNRTLPKKPFFCIGIKEKNFTISVPFPPVKGSSGVVFCHAQLVRLSGTLVDPRLKWSISLICFCGREYFPRWSPDALYFGP